MRFWDSSAIVPLLIREPEHADTQAALEDDPAICAWWGTPTECVSAIARRERDGSLIASSVVLALDRLNQLAASWHEVEPTSALRQGAIRLLRVHPLRAADALQLSAALAASEDHPATMPFITYDERLADAAEREGLRVLMPGKERR